MANNTTFIIYNTAGSPISAIQPNTLDGPEGVQQNSDLRMYGLGFPNWGEGVNENEYHIVENFACPPLSNFPSSARYALLGPTVAAITPAGDASDELGTGNGINVPLVGQFWYNTTNNKLYINNAAYPNASWSTVGTQAVATGGVPGYPTLGSLWYDQTVAEGGITLPQLLVYNGSSWNSVAANYLPLTGGTLSGTLNMSSTIAMGGNKITNLGTPTLSTDAATKGYVDSAISGADAAYLPTAGGTMTGPLYLSNTNLAINTSGTALLIEGGGGISLDNGTLTIQPPSGNIAINGGGGRVANIGYPVVNTDAARCDWVQANALLLTGGNVSGTTTFARVQQAAAPTVGNDLTNKTYVDSQVSGSQPTTTIATNGKIEYPGGLIMQWGTINTGTLSGEPGTPYGPYSFAFAFPTACLNCMLTGNGGAPLGITNITRTSFSVWTGYTGGSPTNIVYYFAVGH